MTIPLLQNTPTSPRDELEIFRDIFDNASIGIFQSTPEGRYIRVNASLAATYGYDDERSLMIALTDIGHQLYVEPGRREEFISTLLENGGIENFESEVHHKDGSTIWISENARVVYDGTGKILYFEGFVKNVTQRIMLESKLPNSPKPWSKAFKNAPAN